MAIHFNFSNEIGGYKFIIKFCMQRFRIFLSINRTTSIDAKDRVVYESLLSGRK